MSSMNTDKSAVTLEAFAARVGCHFTTASRLRAGQRMPSRKLLGRIIRAYGLDPVETMTVYTSGSSGDFGKFLLGSVFERGKPVDRDRQFAVRAS
jgi:transcriptional regulator with XRE-family HTH domain